MKLDKLSIPFPAEKIHWRVGSTNKKKVARETGNQNAKPTKGIPLAYIDARDVMERLDIVCGPGNWQCRYPFTGCCEIGIKIDGEWVWKANGAGVTDYEAEKGQYSDAFKRAAVLWGIGRYLYDLPNTWVDLDDWGNPKQKPTLPQWALPGAYWTTPKKQEFQRQVSECLDNNDEHGLRELFSEVDNEEKVMVWNLFTSQQRTLIKEML